MSATTPTAGGASGSAPTGTRRALGLATLVLAVAGQLVVGFFTLTAIGLIGMPVWAALLLVLAWAAGAVAIALLARRRPLLTPAVPIAGALVLWGLVAAGGAWLGWSG
jgi:uncharacterized protein (DUF983 family)